MKKMIVAIVRPFTLDRIIVGLESIEAFPGMTVVDSEGYRSEAEDLVDPFKPYKRIEVIADANIAPVIVSTIRQHAHTGRKGDGIVFVLPVEDVQMI